MTTVYVVLKHPMHPYASDQFLEAGVIKGVFSDKRSADNFAKAKNANKPFGLYAVHKKRVTLPEAPF